MRAECLAQEHGTRTARSGVEGTSHEVTSPPSQVREAVIFGGGLTFRILKYRTFPTALVGKENRQKILSRITYRLTKCL